MQGAREVEQCHKREYLCLLTFHGVDTGSTRTSIIKIASLQDMLHKTSKMNVMRIIQDKLATGKYNNIPFYDRWGKSRFIANVVLKFNIDVYHILADPSAFRPQHHTFFSPLSSMQIARGQMTTSLCFALI